MKYECYLFQLTQLQSVILAACTCVSDLYDIYLQSDSVKIH